MIVCSAKSEHMTGNVQGNTLPGGVKPATSHSYNLRSRVASTSAKMQE